MKQFTLMATLATLATTGCLAAEDDGSRELVHMESTQEVADTMLSSDVIDFLSVDHAVGSQITFPERSVDSNGIETMYMASITTINADLELEELEYEQNDQLDDTHSGEKFSSDRASRIMHCDGISGAPNRQRGARVTSCYGWKDSLAERSAEGWANSALASSGVCEPLASSVPGVCDAHGSEIARSDLSGSFTGVPSLPAPSDIDICGRITNRTISHTRGANTCGAWPIQWQTFITRSILRSRCGALCF